MLNLLTLFKKYAKEIGIIYVTYSQMVQTKQTLNQAWQYRLFMKLK